MVDFWSDGKIEEDKVSIEFEIIFVVVLSISVTNVELIRDNDLLVIICGIFVEMDTVSEP
jgi:hypothetical protein